MRWENHLKKQWWYVIYLVLCVLVALSLLLVGESPSRWAAFASLISLPIVSILYLTGFLYDDIKSSALRYATLHFFVGLPLLSFSLGKMDANYIRGNFRYQYMIHSSSETSSQDTLKLLGFTSDKIFFSTLDNKEIVV